MPGLYARQGAHFIANSSRFDDQRRPNVVKLASGNFVVVWDDFSRTGGDTDLDAVRAQMFDPNGRPIGGEFLVNSTTLRSQLDSHVAPLSNGGFVISWTDYNIEGADNHSSSIKSQMYDSGGNRVGGETLVNTTVPGYQMSAAVSGLPGGGYVAVWVDVQSLLSLQGNIRGQLFDSAGGKVGTEFTVNTLADNRQTSPTVTTLADGRFVVTWTDGTAGTLDGSGHSVRGQMFAASGERIGSEFQVNESGVGNQHSQSVTALAGGGFLAIWADQQGFPGSETMDPGGSALEGQIFDANGNRVGGEFLINPHRRTSQSGASVAAMPDGTFVVSWNDWAYNDNDEIWSHIAAQAFDARGNRLGSRFYLETHQSVHDQTALAALDGGRFVAVWHGGAGSAYHNYYPGEIYTQIFAPARGVLDIALSNAVVSETQPNNLQIGTIAPTLEAVNANVSYAILADSTGGGFRIEGNRIVVADNSRLNYEAGPDVTLTIRAFDGAGGHYDEIVRLTLSDVAIERRWSASEEVQVNTDADWDQVDPAVAGLAGGGHVVVWEDPNSGGDWLGPSIKAQMYDSAGARLGEEFRVNGPMGKQQFDPSVAHLAGGGFVVTWTEYDPMGAEGSSIKAMIFDGAGKAIAGEFGEFFVQADPAQPGDQANSAVAGLASGGFAVAWYDPAADGGGGGIKARLFGATGQPAGAERIVNSARGGEQDQPAIASLASGGFLVTWTDASGNSDFSGTGIKGQRFDSAGNPVGGEFLVNTVLDGSQSASSAAGLSGGGFVVAWQQLAGPARAQLFDSAGQKAGAEFVVAQWGYGPAVTALPDGGFIIALQADGGEGRDPAGIVARQYDSAGRPVGAEWVVNEAVPGNQREPAIATLASGGLAIAWMEPIDSPVNDRNGGSIRGRTFSAPAASPEAADDRFTTSESARLTGSVFADNGSGPDTGNPEVATVNGSAAAVGQQIRLASGALLTLNADGSFSYDSNGAFAPLVDPQSGAANSAASDSFTYSLTGGSSADVSVRITGVTASGEPFMGSSANDRLTGTAAADLFRLQQGGDDYASGGAGDDVFWFGAAMNWLDQIGGGEGADRIVLQGNYHTHFGTGSFFEVETLALLSGQDNSFGGGSPQSLYSYTLSLLDAAVLAGHTLTLDAAGLRSGEVLSLSAGNVRGALVVRGGEAGDGIATGNGNDIVYGGGGNDTITGGAGDDIVYGGAGNDTLDGSGGHDDIMGEAGDDTLRISGSDPDSADGGAGHDTLILDFGADTSGISRYPNLGGYSALGGHEGGYQDGTGRFVGYAEIERFVITTGSGNDVIETGDGDDVVTAGAGNDRITSHAGNDLLDGGTGADSMTGGTGNDVYVVDDAGDTVGESAGGGTDEVRTTLANFSLLVLPEVENLTGTSATGQTLEGNSKDNVVAGGAGHDILRLHQGGNDTVNAGAGNDNIFFIGALTSADVVDGGAGVDTLVVQGPYGSLVLTANITQIENLSILGGNNTNFGEPGTNRHDYVLTTHDSNFGAGVQARINGSALLAGEDFTFDGRAETDASYVVYGGKGRDTLTGGLGHDIFFFAEERFATGDTVNGGAGYDGMFLRGNYTIDFNAPGYTGLFTNIENLTLTSATDERYARGGGTEFDYNLTLSDAIVGAGQQLTVSGALLMGGETMVLDASRETNGTLRLFGGFAWDTLKGGANADLLHGNLGADMLTGGGGADTFRYQSTAESTMGSIDQIMDFAPGADKIDLTRIDASTLAAGDQAFRWIGASTFTGAGASSAGELRAYQAGAMWFAQGDTNGDGMADLVIALTLQGAAPLGQGDFLL